MQDNENKLKDVNPKLVEWMEKCREASSEHEPMFGRICGKGVDDISNEPLQQRKPNEEINDYIDDEVVIEPKISKRTKERGLTIKYKHESQKEKKGFYFSCQACGKRFVVAQLGEDLCSGCLSSAYDTTYQPEYVHGNLCDDSGANAWDEHSNLKDIGE